MPPKRKAQNVETKSHSHRKGGAPAAKKRKLSKISSKPKPSKKKDKGKAVPQTSARTNKIQLSDLISDHTWKNKLAHLFKNDYSSQIEQFLQIDYSAGKQIFPPRELIFNAFNITPINQVKVVILGQDPYHDDNQAHGLSFSVPKGLTVPPSLKNIYKELESDVAGFNKPDHGCLEAWAKQGILMLNATLTVEAHKPNSHAKYGWQKFTDDVMRLISDECSGVVFILWGGFAHKKEKLIDPTRHCVIKTAHPSPLSFNKFFGCKCFSKANNALKNFGKEPINWTL